MRLGQSLIKAVEDGGGGVQVVVSFAITGFRRLKGPY